MKYTQGSCAHEDGCDNPIENPDTGLCASHGALQRKQEREMNKPQKEKKKIAQVSFKMKKELSVYSATKGPWIKDKRCAVDPSQPATDVHHMKGKVGYADKWARDNGIPLLIDKRFWLPVCRTSHIKITDNSSWAEANGYSLPRVEEK
jgi:hypothetical protein